MIIKTVSDLRKAVRETRQIFPGGYEFCFLASGGGELCRKCVIRNIRQVIGEVSEQNSKGSWFVYGSESTSNMEAPVICDNCDRILLEAD